MEKQVTYFEAIYRGGIEQHYVKDTKDFDTLVEIFNHFDIETEVTYIAYDDGTTEGTPVNYIKIM